MSETSSYYQDRDQEFSNPSLDIETAIKTFENLFLKSRLVSRLFELQPNMETGIKNFKIAVWILRLESRFSTFQS